MAQFSIFMPYPGSIIAEEVAKTDFPMPKTLEEWSEFDFVGTSGPWMDSEKFKRMERFKFYNHLAGLGGSSLLHLLPRSVARWRCAFDFSARRFSGSRTAPDERHT
jgi:hypothetical protein